MTKEIKVNGDTIIYNGATYKKVEEPKEPTLRDRIVEVLQSHIDMYEYANHIDTYPLAQDLMDHIVEWIPDYSHNTEMLMPKGMSEKDFECYEQGWDAHAKETFKVFDWFIK